MIVRDLRNEIEGRRERGKETRNRIEEFCREVHGIPDFFGIVGKHFPNGLFTVHLARQIPTFNVEHAACQLLAPWLSKTLNMSTSFLALSLTQDTFVMCNEYKKSLVKMPWLGRGRNGLFLHHQAVVPKCELIEGRPLCSIRTTNGARLPEYHTYLRRRVFGRGGVHDCSFFLRECLYEALKNGRGPRAYQHQGYLVRNPPMFEMKNLLPPAEWFYLFYLLLFVDGNRALLSTVGDNEEVGGWFGRAISQTQKVVGVAPLIINTPVEVQVNGYSSNLLEYPRPLLQKGWQKQIKMPAPNPSITVFQAVECLERQIIGLV